MGQYTSPIWITRAIIYWLSDDVVRNAAFDPNSQLRLRDICSKSSGPFGWLDVGPIDPHDTNAVRQDGYLRDGDGSLYWGLSTFLPGFRQFRYPGKMMTFACLGLSALAGVGWDRLVTGGRRRAGRIALSIMAITGIILGCVLTYQYQIIGFFKSNNSGSPYGQFDPIRAYRGVVFSLLHTLVLMGLFLWALKLVISRPRIASIVALAVLSVDLAIANARLVISTPQEDFDSTPQVVKIIRDAEREKPADGPYRVYRMPQWNPMGWNHRRSDNRVQEFTRWERDTLQPKYGITEGVEYTHAKGVSQLYDYEMYFAAFPREASPGVAKMLRISSGDRVAYYPRRAYDMWNTRYFVVPEFAGNWSGAARGYAAFLPDTELIYPKPDSFQGPLGPERQRAWIETGDFRILRNEHAYPRAWISHDLRPFKKSTWFNPNAQKESIQEILYADDLFWHSQPGLQVRNPRVTVWVDEADEKSLKAFCKAGLPRGSESVNVVYRSPQCVEMECTLKTPGLVILSDVFYPGWTLTIDDRPSRIYRVNQIMRGAAVSSGTHKLTYSFTPFSFQIGGIISLASLASLVVLFAFFWMNPASSIISPDDREAWPDGASPRKSGVGPG